MKRFGIMLAIMTAVMLFVTEGCSWKDDGKIVETCECYDILFIGEYALVNAADTTGFCSNHYYECISVNYHENTYGWTWERILPVDKNDRHTIYAYIHYGRTPPYPDWPSDDERNTTSTLPIVLEQTASISIDYDILLSTTSQYGVYFTAAQFFYTGGNYVHERVRIYIDATLPPSSVDFQARVTIDGKQYDYYMSKDIFLPANPIYGSSTRTIITHYLVPLLPTHTGTAYLLPFLNFLRNEGHSTISEIDYLRLSQEIWGGGVGSTTIRNFSIAISLQ